jgi:hypothetical protein
MKLTTGFVAVAVLITAILFAANASVAVFVIVYSVFGACSVVAAARTR